jgi:cobalt-zinc-cadmium efflux system membrane fusion protein
MNNRVSTTIACSLLLALGLVACGGGEKDASHDDGHGQHEGEDEGDGHDHGDEEHGHGAEEEGVPQGPNGGRLHEQGELAVELKIEEDGVEPRYAAWVTRDGKPVDPAQAQLEVVLERLGGRVDTHKLLPKDGRLAGDSIVREPHSFVVTLRATVGGERAEWTYESFEGRTTINAKAADEAGVRVAAVAGGTIAETLKAQGQVVVPPGRTARVAARFQGVVREVRVEVGDRVNAGQTLASVDSNASLSRYAVVSPIAGTVLERHAEPGALVADAPLFVVADLGTLAADLALFGSDAARVSAGARVQLRRVADGRATDATVERVLPVADAGSQSLLARVAVANDDGLWRPGMAVDARVVTGEAEVPMRLPLAAVQRIRDGQVAFIRVGDTYEVRPLELGRSDGTWVEVKEGLEVGDEVVIEQSFLIKADIEKSGASHDH